MSRANRKSDERLLKIHQLHLGLYARISTQLGVTASYVSRVARGERQSERVTASLVRELRKLSQLA